MSGFVPVCLVAAIVPDKVKCTQFRRFFVRLSGWLVCLGGVVSEKLMHVLDKSGKSWYTKDIPCGRGETGRHDRFRLRYYIEK